MAKIAAHGTLSNGVVSTITLDKYWSRVQIVNRSDREIFFSVDGVTAPTINGDDIFVVAAGTSVTVANRGAAWEPVYYQSDIEAAQQKTPANTVVKLIATGAANFSVQGAS
jgi:hypothetical protein